MQQILQNSKICFAVTADIHSFNEIQITSENSSVKLPLLCWLSGSRRVLHNLHWACCQLWVIEGWPLSTGKYATGICRRTFQWRRCSSGETLSLEGRSRSRETTGGRYSVWSVQFVTSLLKQFAQSLSCFGHETAECSRGGDLFIQNRFSHCLLSQFN